MLLYRYAERLDTLLSTLLWILCMKDEELLQCIIGLDKYVLGLLQFLIS